MMSSTKALMLTMTAVSTGTHRAPVAVACRFIVPWCPNSSIFWHLLGIPVLSPIRGLGFKVGFLALLGTLGLGFSATPYRTESPVWSLRTPHVRYAIEGPRHVSLPELLHEQRARFVWHCGRQGVA